MPFLGKVCCRMTSNQSSATRDQNSHGRYYSIFARLLRKTIGDAQEGDTLLLSILSNFGKIAQLPLALTSAKINML